MVCMDGAPVKVGKAYHWTEDEARLVMDNLEKKTRKRYTQGNQPNKTSRLLVAIKLFGNKRSGISLKKGNIRALIEWFKLDAKEFGMEDDEYSTKDVLYYNSTNANTEIHNKNTVLIAISAKYEKFNKKECKSSCSHRRYGNNKLSELFDEAPCYNTIANEYNITPDGYNSD